MKESKEEKAVVVILPVTERGEVLMQLRDLKPNITAPGCWGFFGGGIDAGEAPEHAAIRELEEETGLVTRDIISLGREEITDLNGLVAYGYCCRLKQSVDSLQLTEGIEMQLLTKKDIENRQAYSKTLERNMPTVSTYYIEKMFKLALDKVKLLDQ